MIQTFKLTNLGCASCAAKMQAGIQALPGVRSAKVSFLTTKLVIDAEEGDLSDVTAAAAKIVKQYEPHCQMVKV